MAEPSAATTHHAASGDVTKRDLLRYLARRIDALPVLLKFGAFAHLTEN